MLTATYLHTSGIGSVTERSLWEQGATSWTAFLSASERLRIPTRHRGVLVSTIEDSVAALGDARADYFAHSLP